jgi:hypothetical protein
MLTLFLAATEKGLKQAIVILRFYPHYCPAAFFRSLPDQSFDYLQAGWYQKVRLTFFNYGKPPKTFLG